MQIIGDYRLVFKSGEHIYKHLIKNLIKLIGKTMQIIDILSLGMLILDLNPGYRFPNSRTAERML